MGKPYCERLLHDGRLILRRSQALSANLEVTSALATLRWATL
jgi:hypothetical protein